MTTTTSTASPSSPTWTSRPSSFSYNRLDLEATKDRAGRWTRTLHNALRQPIAQIAPDGRTAQLEWCRCGDLRKLIDPLGRVTWWKRDQLGRVVEKLLPDGATKTTYTYQPLSGRLASMTQPNDQPGPATVNYHYFVDGRLQREDYTDPAMPDVNYQYTTTNPGTTLDPLGRLTFVDDGIGTHALTYVPLTTGTAGAGRLQKVNGPLPNDTIQYSYDWENRVTTEDLLDDASTPNNLRTETMGWDSLGRTGTVANTLGTFTYGYTTNLSRPDTLTRPNSLTTSYGYHANNTAGDKARKLESITHTLSGQQKAKHLYDYDPAGRITSWERQSVGRDTYRSKYGYNLADELIQHEETNVTASGALRDREMWGLDTAGNWLSRTRQDVTGSVNVLETRALDGKGLNQLMQIGGAGTTVVEGNVSEFATVTVSTATSTGAPLDTGPAGLRADPAGGYRFRRQIPVAEGNNKITITATDQDNQPTQQSWQFTVPAVQRSFTYDKNGNTLSAGLRTFTWDAKNRLRTVTVASNTWKWDYDYRDRRVREYLNNTLTQVFIWSGNEIVQERTASNAISRTHYFGGFSDGPTATTGTKYQTLTDHLGHLRDVLTTTGALAARYDYTPYQGPVKVGTSTVEPTLLTIGRYYHHAGSGLELALYRAYDPELGRWLSRDPLNDAEIEEGSNLFRYVSNQPVSRLDVDGLRRPPDFDDTNPNLVQECQKACLDILSKCPGGGNGFAMQNCFENCADGYLPSPLSAFKPPATQPKVPGGIGGCLKKIGEALWDIFR